MKMISLGTDEDNFDGFQETKNVGHKFAMDSYSLAVGSPSGLIKVLARKDLCVVIRYHLLS